MKMAPIVGSRPPRTLHAHAVGDVSPDQVMTVTVRLKSRAADLLRDKHLPIVGREEFADEYGAPLEGIDKVQDYAVSHGLVVSDADPAKRQVVLHGTVSQFEKAFEVTLRHYQFAQGTFRSHEQSISIPSELLPYVETVLGLSNHPVAHPHFQYASSKSNWIGALHAVGQSAGPVPMTANRVATLYNFPTAAKGNLTGKGRCIAIIELGGGYQPADMAKYFKSLSLAVPTIVDVSVGGAKNTPGSDADGEVELDIQVAGTIAPQARIAVYFADNSIQGFVNAIVEASHDQVNKPDVISISWGGPEPTWNWADMSAMNNAIRDAGLLGITVTVASGDAGSNDGYPDTLAHTDFPASSPYVLACGGTRLIGNSGMIASETVWNDASDSASGGGISHHYDVPSYQQPLNIQKSSNHPAYSGRGVPDIAGNADPNTGFTVIIDGSREVVGGTSAVAPLYAGLIALACEAKGKKLGFINPTLYKAAGQVVFRSVMAPGNNGSYQAKPGDKWNPCVGLGSIDGVKFLGLF
jgi:kumamolisin